ncbi:MAG: 4-hydroxy-tetrahydrodipicolinate reductase [Caulobacteraceae bacterium]|nr:4-hydroxy-tetrahydrodipicolinate reductase [Caulobacteraceae bacterium]
MGSAVRAAIETDPRVELAAALGRESGPDDLARALAGCEVVVDVSAASAATALADAAAGVGRPALVIGATGFSPDEEARIAAAGRTLAIVKSGNFSIGVALLARLTRQAAAALPAETWDIDILDIHHRDKRDAPSGTAKLLAAAASAGRATAAADGTPAPGRAAPIGFASLRAGGIVGEHSVLFAAAGEIIVLSHSARDRSLFAAGAIAAALWVRGRTPGVYGMEEVLDLRPPAAA